MMLPPVSLPIENPTSPAAVAAPGPALDPEEPSSSNHGFMVCPPKQMSFDASAPRLSFAQHSSGFIKPLDQCRVFIRHPVAIRLGSVGRRNAGSIEQVFSSPRNAVKGPAIPPRCHLFVRALRLRHRTIGGQGDHAS
jgi:hypothetical protein